MKPPRERDELRSAACAYAALGWCVIPVPVGQKRPVTEAWQRQRLTPAEVLARWEQPHNIGVLLGDASGGLVDVDLDTPEAVELAAEYLPPDAWIFGRGARPRTHYLYSSPGCRSVVELLDLPDANGKRAMLVELRASPAGGEGHQTIFPPSRYAPEVCGRPEGDVLAWDDANDAGEAPRSVDALELTARVRALAGAVFLARHLPGGVPAARAWLVDPKPEALSPAVATHWLRLRGLAPTREANAPARREAPRPGRDFFESFKLAGVENAASVLGLEWDARRRALVVCPACRADTRSSRDKRAAAGVVHAREGGAELWTHGKCGFTGDALSLAAAELLGTVKPNGPAQWLELRRKLEAKGWKP